MSYRKFTLDELKEKFNIKITREKIVFSYEKKEASNWLIETLKKSKNKRLTTEKAKCEFIIAPILSELEDYYNDSISLFSGETLNADIKAGLCGEVDFVFTKGVEYIRAVAPIVAVVGAKKSDLNQGFEQCSAQLVGMSLINQKSKKELFPLYGCVTNSKDWIFLRLDKDKIITIDTEEYFINDLETILGIFVSLLK